MNEGRPSCDDRRLTEEELDAWLQACDADPSILTPHEMGWMPDGTRKRKRP